METRNQQHVSYRRSAGSARVVVGVACMLVVGSILPVASAAETDPKAVLKAMSDYLAKQPTVAAKINSSIEIVTPDMEKIQFDSSSTVQLKRPDKLSAERIGGYAAVRLLFDGKTLTIQDLDKKQYAQVGLSGTIDELVDHMHQDLGLVAPGADLLLSDVYSALSADVMQAKYIGQGMIDGRECEHLAFRNAESDWQLWVRTGSDPIPCKMVITSKMVTGAPQYTLEIRDWNTGAAIDDAAFAFKLEGDLKKIEPKELSGLDELPEPAAQGGAQK